MSDLRYSRKDFFRRSFVAVADSLETLCKQALAVKHPKAKPPLPSFVRPPGAGDEAAFLDACTRCDACVIACPPKVIRKAGPELGAAVGAGSPILIPAENACLMCEDFPCIAACEPGALRPEEEARAIGLAVVNETTCYMAMGQPCDYCQTYCPEVPLAIRVGDRGSAAVVDGDACTGCGRCAELCPARAIEIVAR